VLKIDPNHADAWNGKGNALEDLNRYDEAITCYDRALKIDPNHADAWNNKGNALEDLNRYDEAITCYDRALKIDPNYTSTWNNKGNALQNLNRYDEAITCYDQALKIYPNDALVKRNRELAQNKITEQRKQNPSRSPRSGEPLRSSQSAVPPVKAAAAKPPITVERTVYDPLARKFVVSSPRPLSNVKNWIDRHDPASYWLVVCVHNHGDRTIEDWGIELDSSSSLKILDAAIEGIDGQMPLHTTHPKPWLIQSILGISHHHGIVIPRDGSRRVYFRLGSESCGVSHTIQGRFIAKGAEAEILAKQFLHSCDVATLGMAMRQDPTVAERFTENVLRQRYQQEIASKYLHTFHLVLGISDCCHEKRFEDVHDKLYTLEDALEKMGVSDNLVGLVQRLNAMDIHDGMGRSMLELKAREAKRMCRNIIDAWKNEVLLAP
jgi:predicted negative regulator of RcsB-dependent stress response